MPLSLEEKRKYQREWVAKRRADFFLDKSCIICGSTDRLELDHIDPNQKTSHRIWSWSLNSRLLEIAKCQILCISCHKKKTHRDNDNGYIVHGTEYRGYKKGCRCRPCTDAHTSAVREWRLKDKHVNVQ